MMKNLFIFVCAALGAVSCVSRGSADRMQTQIDSLQCVVEEKETLIDEVFASINSISENLSQIRSREGSIALAEGEIADSSTLGRMSDDVAAIDRLLLENRARIAELERKAELLRKANVKIAGLEKLIDGLNARIAEQDSEIAGLKERLQQAGARVKELDEEVAARTEEVAELSGQKANLEAEVTARTEELHTAYYIIAPQKELMRDRVIDRKGFIGRTLKVDEMPNLALFTKGDTRLLKTLPIGQKGVTVVTSHPEDSYWLVESEEDRSVVESLVILDAEKFWSLSKILVVSYK